MIIHTVSESAALSTFPQSISLASLYYTRLSCCIVSIGGQLHKYIELKEKVFHFGKHVSLPRLLLKHLALACDFKFWNWIFSCGYYHWLLFWLPDWQDGWLDDSRTVWTLVDGSNFSSGLRYWQLHTSRWEQFPILVYSPPSVLSW